jgi:hypothetical protein
MPCHSSTLIAALSAPNSLHICVDEFPDSDCVNAASAHSFRMFFAAQYRGRFINSGASRCLGGRTRLKVYAAARQAI